MPVSGVNASFVSDASSVAPVPAVDTKKAVEAAQKKVKCTSYTLMVLSLLGVIVSGCHYFGALKVADKIVNGRHHHGHHDDDQEED